MLIKAVKPICFVQDIQSAYLVETHEDIQSCLFPSTKHAAAKQNESVSDAGLTGKNLLG